MSRIVAALIGSLALGLAASTADAAPGDIILRGGKVYTLDTARPWADAVVIRAGKIAYVGGEAGLRRFRPGARVIALHGRMVLPGFHDAHIHPMTGAMRLIRCKLGGLASADAVYAAVGACAAAKPKGDWLYAVGWAPSAFATSPQSFGRLDAVTPDRPAFLTTEDGFTAWANSRALTLAGIDPDSTGPAIDGLQRDLQTHKPTGVVSDAAADRIRRVIPRPTQAEYRQALRLSSAMANRAGITSMFDASVTEPVLDAYHAADLAGELTVRIVAAQRIDPAAGPGQVDQMILLRDRVRGPRVRADAAKIFVDEEIDRHTAALLQPYADAPETRGEPLIQPAALDAVVRRLDAEGFMIHMHVMGDRAVRMGLDAIEKAEQANGSRDRRHQLAHIGVADLADMPRFGRLGVGADFQPVWFHADDPYIASIQAALGPERSRWIYPMGAIANFGGRIIAGSDWPGPTLSPLDGIQYAMTRRPLDGSAPAFIPQERVSLATAIAAYTREAAWGAREDDVDGAIQRGKAADLVVLDRNLFAVNVTDIHKVRVLLTLLDGTPVYRDPALAWPTGRAAPPVRPH